MTYSKEFLIDCFLWRYEQAHINTRVLACTTEKLYDTVDRKRFREYCSLTAQELKNYGDWLQSYGYAPTY